MGIKNYYNLFALEKIRDDLKKWIRKDREFLDEYKHFYYRDGELYFHLRHPGIHLNGSPTKLEDLPLTSKQKENIEAVCHKIRDQEADLRYKEREIKELHKRDNSRDEFLGKDSEKEEYEKVLSGKIKEVARRKGKSEAKDTKRKVNRTKYKDSDLIEVLINCALKIKTIPKLKDLEGSASNSTWSRKFSNKKFLIDLLNTLQSRKIKKYPYSVDTTLLFEDMIQYYNGKFSTLRKQKKELPEMNEYGESDIQLSQSDRKRNRRPYLDPSSE